MINDLAAKIEYNGSMHQKEYIQVLHAWTK